MKALMFGWEFPPHISGGLGTASYGMTEGLCKQPDMEITFVMPKMSGDEDRSFMKILNASNVPLVYKDVDYNYVKERIGHITDPRNLLPPEGITYMPTLAMLTNDLGCNEFSGKYLDNLYEK